MAEHGKAKARQQKDRAWRREKAKRKEALRTKSDAAKSAQQAFNKWVRMRDAGKPCVSCGRPDDGTHQRHASHYRSRGAHPELAFDPDNVHASCAQCNAILSGNIVEYRMGLIRRIGQDALESLEGPHEPARYTIEQLDKIAAHYRAECRRIERESR